MQDDLRRSPLETYEEGHSSYQVHRDVRDDFAKTMRQARICIFDSSLEKKMIRKVSNEEPERFYLRREIDSLI